MVHNCDACSQALARLVQSTGYLELPSADDDVERAAEHEEMIYLSDAMYRVYDTDGFDGLY